MNEEKKEEKLNLYQKLQRCRVELQQANLKKGGFNKYAGFQYYELADFLPTINVLFDKYGLLSIFNVASDKSKATLTIIDCENEKSIVFETPIEEAPLKGCTPIQQLGSVHTYLKRYLYLNALEIVENDLLDSQAGNVQLEEKKLATQEQLDILFANDAMSQWSLKMLGTNEPTYEQAETLIKKMEAVKAKREQSKPVIEEKKEEPINTQEFIKDSVNGSEWAKKASEIFGDKK